MQRTAIAAVGRDLRDGVAGHTQYEMPNSQIAEKLHFSHYGIGCHVSDIYRAGCGSFGLAADFQGKDFGKPRKQQRPPPHPIDQPHGDNRHQHIHQANAGSSQNRRRGGRKPGRLENGGSVISVELIGLAWAFWLYGLLAVAAFVFCYYLVPETKGRSLKVIEASWRSGQT